MGRSRRSSGRPSGCSGPARGWSTLGVWVALLVPGLYQQINLILLVAGLAAGPIVASFFVSAAMLRKLRVTRRVPPYVFAGEPLHLDYTLENDRRWTAALALFVEDDLVPVDRSVSGSTGLAPRVFFPGCRAGRRPGSAGKGSSPTRGQVPLPDARPGHPLAVRPAGTPGHDRRARRADRLSRGRPAHPPLAPGPAPGERDPARPAARPLGAAAGISRPARLPARRQPALDPLADLGAARQADGQGVRAAERAGPGRPDRPLAAADAR